MLNEFLLSLFRLSLLSSVAFFRRCECRGVNAAGRLLIDYASAAECVLGTGRVLGDFGQATFVGSPGQLLVGLIM